MIKDDFNEILEEYKKDIFDSRKPLNKKGCRKWFNLARSSQKINESTASKMLPKELEVQESTKRIKERDEEKIRSHVMSLMRKGTPNPSNGTSSALVPPATSSATQVATSTPVLTNINNLDRRSSTWREGGTIG